MKRKTIILSILSFLYATFIIIGNSFLIKGSFAFLKKYLFLNLILYILLIIGFYYLLKIIFNFLEKKKSNLKLYKLKNLKIYQLFNKHPFIFSLIFMLICWLPYFIAFYPAILSPDPSYQIKQFFHIPNKYSTYAIMLDPKVTITNHHPVLHTLLLGSCVKIGTLINNVNLGLFLYTIIQTLILASTLALTIKFLKKLNINILFPIIALIMYSFIPIFPFYALSAVKDVIFGSLIILYTMTLYHFIHTDKITLKCFIWTIILLIFITLFRNNGIHTIILSFPFLIFIVKNRQERFKIGLICILILGFNYSYNSLILPYFKITPGSIRETLSVPFQQTARLVKEHDKSLSKEDKQAIDKILTYDTLKTRYNPDLADPVKNGYNKYATSQDLKNYFKVWFKDLTKYPLTYVEATINNTYGYYYPFKTNWNIYYKYDTRIVKDGFNYHYNNLKGLRNVLAAYGLSYQYIPFQGLLINIGFNVWLLIFMFAYLFYQKKYRDLVYLTPSLVLVLVCLLSPANCYFRYALPFVFGLMLNLGIFLKSCKG